MVVVFPQMHERSQNFPTSTIGRFRNNRIFDNNSNHNRNPAYLAVYCSAVGSSAENFSFWRLLRKCTGGKRRRADVVQFVARIKFFLKGVCSYAAFLIRTDCELLSPRSTWPPHCHRASRCPASWCHFAFVLFNDSF